MATGDLKNNLRKLKTELRYIHYEEQVAWNDINVGLTEPLLPILHHLFAEYSCELTSYFAYKGYDMFGKSDLRFIEVIYKILIKEFSTKPMLTKQQFFTVGFTEMKVIFITKMISLCRSKTTEIVAKLKKNKKYHGKSKVTQSKMTITREKEWPTSNHDENSVDFHVEPNTAKDPLISSKNQEKPENFQNSILDLTIEEPEALANLNDLSEIYSVEELNNMSTCGKKSPVVKKDIMDLTEIDDEDDELDVTQEDSTVVEMYKQDFPRFTIQKHTLPEVKIIQDSLKTDSSSRKVDKCSQCSKHEVEMKNLTERLSVLEKQFSKTLSVNNELSAKVIILETKVKFLEKPLQENTTVIDLKNVPINQNRQENIDKSPVSDGKPTLKMYSPMKYSDDEVIIRDFRPLRMKDVRKAQGLANDKENVVMFSQGSLKSSTEDKSSNFVNVSFDSKTKDTIANVQKYLQETDMLLLTKTDLD